MECKDFEEVLYQANLFSSGSLNVVLTGKYYNRCWWAHENISEAIESFNQISNTEVVASLLGKYHESKLQGLQGQLSVTAQFWLKYIDIIKALYQLQLSIYRINFSLNQMAWEVFFTDFLCNKQSLLRSLRQILHTAFATVRTVSSRLIK